MYSFNYNLDGNALLIVRLSSDKMDAEQIAAWEEQEAALQATEEQISQEIEEAQQEVADLQQQLDEVNARGAAKPKTPENTNPEERKEHTAMNTNTRKLWFGMDHQERDAFMAREDVKAFAQRVRERIGEKRGLTGADLTIPTEMLDVLRDNLNQYSKLITKVRLRSVSGHARQNVIGKIPEGIWMEMAGALNNLEFRITDIETDGFKVGGFIPIDN